MMLARDKDQGIAKSGELRRAAQRQALAGSIVLPAVAAGAAIGLLPGVDIADWMRNFLVIAILACLTGTALLGMMLLRRATETMMGLEREGVTIRNEIESLRHQVREGTQAVEEARAHADGERERAEALLHETSHRIGNSLATVSSLLALQLLRSTSEEVKLALDAARARVHAIAAAHRRLRLGDDMENTTADDFLDAVLQDLAGSVADKATVKLTSEIEPIEIKARDATTVGILVGELVSNALKHAFPDSRSGWVKVALKRDAAGTPTLTVSDNGVGLDNPAEPGHSGLGTLIIKQLARQFGGVPTYDAGEERGLTVTVPLPGIEPGRAAD